MVSNTVPGAAGPSPSAPAPEPSATSAGLPTGPVNTRLRNAESDLCLDVRDGRAVAGAEATMADCTSGQTQKWVYEQDGLLRSAAAPDLCLSSHEIDGVSVLDACSVGSAPNAGDVRYDLTIQGNVIPRWNEGLALVPASVDRGAKVVVKVRDGSQAQRWATDGLNAAPRIQPDGSTGAPTTAEVNVPPEPRAGRSHKPRREHGDARPGPRPKRERDSQPPGHSVRRVGGAERAADAALGPAPAPSPVPPPRRVPEREAALPDGRAALPTLTSRDAMKPPPGGPMGRGRPIRGAAD
ncbi:RICIN domain-containing protein [Streptomyces sp. NPDC051907]|uniref:RICIN domain-containing protein n=1 Tax=Streptomyces sp. NPDC051907 TaxID=3155284 RepID=UPI0034467C14